MTDVPDIAFNSFARVTNKRFGVAPQGVLALADGRLSFSGAGVAFDVALDRIERVWSPWFMLGMGVFIKLPSNRYSATFNKLSTYSATGAGALAEGLSIGVGALDLASAAKLGKAWRAVFSEALGTKV